ncbi:hypothetical protein L0Y65_04135 [Candidatus Micrarchaeota archaeon]|nr:hypothetical protein [Candidatus Micrarchaeota archaeon]
MGSTLKNIILLVISLLIGIGITYMGVSLMEPAILIDQTLQIIIAVVLTLFAYVAFYFMTKGSG